MEIKFKSELHEKLKEFKISRGLGTNTIEALVSSKYIELTQKGLDALVEIEKGKVWDEKNLVKAVVSPNGGYAPDIYKLQAIELGLIDVDLSHNLFTTEKGKQWLKERAINVLQKYKLDLWIIAYLMEYVEDIAILPTYLTSDYDFIRDRALKRFNELQGIIIKATCIDNENEENALTKGKEYTVIPDEGGTLHNYIRVTNDNNKDYLYNRTKFELLTKKGE
jgi:hypothetical protein